MSAERRMREAALAYASRDWPVLPLHSSAQGGGCTCGHADCKSEAKHPRTDHGLKDATTDEARVHSWWERWPRANIGLLTGVAFDAIDVDSPEALDALSDRMPAETGPGDYVNGPTVKTPRGWHCWVAPAGWANTVGLGGLDGIDWRGAGGYVVAPPSSRADGEYSWLLPDDPDFGPLAVPQPVPQWLRALHNASKPVRSARQLGVSGPPKPLPANGFSPAYVEAALEGERAKVASAVKPGRNNALNNAALALGALVGAGVLDLERAWHCLAGAATSTGLPEREVERTLASAFRAGMAQPRRAR